MNERSSPEVLLPRKTIARPVELRGMGVTTGREVTVTLRPHGDGLVFRRLDTGAEVRPSPAAARLGPSWSALGEGDAEVRITEHLLACLAAAGVTDLLVETTGPELPLGDGSARQWWALLAEAGIREIGTSIERLAIAEPVTVHDPKAGQTLAAFPADFWRLVYILDWPHQTVGLQVARFTVGHDDFAAELAPARTFTLADDARRAKQAGLFPGGSEDNLIVVHDDRLSADPGLPNAFARHKLLDLLGDLYLLGRPIRGLFVAYNSGHRLNHQLVARLADLL